MEKNALVSAIITTHNRKELLRKAVQSVLNQTYKNIECIVIDDASNDGTEDALTDLIKNAKIRFHHIDISKGGNHARNLGISLAKGEYIAFLDDDDEWLETKVAKQIKLFSDNVGFVYCGMMLENNFNSNLLKGQDILNKRKFPEGNLAKTILVHIVTNTSTIMVSRKAIERSGVFDENLKAWQEYDFSIRVLQNFDAAVVRENLVLYRICDDDKKKITNNVDKWENSVKYLNRKYSKEIKSLSFREKNQREMYICMDGYSRSNKVRSKTKKLKYIIKAMNPGVAYEIIQRLFLLKAEKTVK